MTSRRFLFLFIVCLVSACHLLLILADSLEVGDAGPNALFTCFVVLLVSVSAIVGDFGRSLYFVIVPELFPYAYRVQAKSLTLLLMESLTAISSMTLYLGLDMFGMKFLLTFIIPQTFLFVFLWVNMPETKGKSNAEVLKSFGITAQGYGNID